MIREHRTVTTNDLFQLKAYIDSKTTNATLDIVYVSDSNHNDTTRPDLSIGSILGKNESQSGKSENTDIVYKPIDVNIKKYPIPGEYVLALRSPLGNYYISSLNLNDNLNNNIDTSRLLGNTKYSDDNITTSSVIRNSKKITTADRISKDFKISRIGKRKINYGDVVFEGRLGNSILLTHSPNNEPLLEIENSNSSIVFFNDEGGYSRITDTKFNDVVEKQFNDNKNGGHLLLNSDRIIMNSQVNGIFLQSRGGSVGVSSDKDIDIAAGRQLSLNGNFIFIGTDKTDQPLVRGKEFASQWTSLIEILHETALSLKQLDNPDLNGIGSLLEKRISDSISPKGTTNIQQTSVSKILSEEVYIR